MSFNVLDLESVWFCSRVVRLRVRRKGQEKVDVIETNNTADHKMLIEEGKEYANPDVLGIL